jgi:hypothetical protein
MLAFVRVVYWTLVALYNANLASRRDEGVVDTFYRLIDPAKRVSEPPII